jgi:hypothetical protein
MLNVHAVNLQFHNGCTQLVWPLPQTGVEPVRPSTTQGRQLNCRPNDEGLGPGKLPAGIARTMLPATVRECEGAHAQAAARPIAKIIAATAQQSEKPPTEDQAARSEASWEKQRTSRRSDTTEAPSALWRFVKSQTKGSW